MKIPKGFKETISAVFYDKEITVYSMEVVKDDYGYTRVEVEPTEVSFLGNIKFDNLQKMQEDYGIKEVIDIAITTDYDVQNNTIIEYSGQKYKIVKVIPSDTHKLVVANRWEQKSTGLISA